MALVGRREEVLERAAGEGQYATDTQADGLFRHCDLSQPDEVRALTERLEESVGQQVGLLDNNAAAAPGLSPEVAPLADAAEHARQELATHLVET